MRERSVLLLLLIFLTSLNTTYGFPILKSSRSASNEFFLSAHNKGSCLPSPKLVILLPAYNEDKRLQETINIYRNYLEHSHCSPDWNTVQILVVDDGSTDNTVQVAALNNDHDVEIRCVSLLQNEGKGAAISRGMREIESYNDSNGDCVILVADADGSGDIECIHSMMSVLTNLIEIEAQKVSWDTSAMVVGCRGYKDTTKSRKITRWGFRTAVKLFCGDLRVKDTQCGFKLMTLPAGLSLYSNLNLKRWSHDVEVLYRAKLDKIPVSEVVINWEDKEGSKLVESVGGTIGVSMTMLFEVMRLRWGYTFGNWK